MKKSIEYKIKYRVNSSYNRTKKNQQNQLKKEYQINKLNKIIY